jgi:hypothetical protein
VTVTIRCCEQLAATPAEVWADVERIETHLEWMVDALTIEFLTPSHRGIGTEFACVTKLGPLRTRDVLVVTAWDPAARMTIEHRGSVQGTGRFLLRAEQDGTEFCWEETLRFPWWMGGPIGERVAQPFFARLWRGNLARLRDRFLPANRPRARPTD